MSDTAIALEPWTRLTSCRRSIWIAAVIIDLLYHAIVSKEPAPRQARGFSGSSRKALALYRSGVKGQKERGIADRAGQKHVEDIWVWKLSTQRGSC